MSKQMQNLSFFYNSFNTQYLQSVLNSPGPHLDQFSACSEIPSIIHMLGSLDFIHSIESIPELEIKFSGHGKQALMKCFSLILLVIGCKQVKFYPHLLTLIKEQFFKPDAFADYNAEKKNRILSICRNIQIELISSISVYSFIETNFEFLQGFSHILNKIIGSKDQPTTHVIDILRKRFNIDCGKIQIQIPSTQCWILGMQRKIYLIEENGYFLLITPSTSTQPTPNFYQSFSDNRIESQKSVSEQIIIEASEESTPKFKDNQQSIRYRKKSHKNSFGGDFEITGYKQLAKLVNKSQVGQSNSKQKQTMKKVFSLKFQTNQRQQFLRRSPQLNQDEQKVNERERQLFQFNFNESNQFVPMKGSNIEGNQKLRKSNEDMEKESKKKQVATSEIFELSSKNMGNRGIFLSIPKLQQQNKINNSNQIYEINHPNLNSQMRDNQNVKIIYNQHMNEPDFKISFSKKDSNKFVHPQLSNFDQIHTTKREEHIQNKITINKVPLLGQGQKMKSSMTNIWQGQIKKVLGEDLYYQKRLENRRSLLIQSAINPIEQQVHNSHQEQTESQSLAQSQSHREKKQIEEDQKRQKKFWKTNQNMLHTNQNQFVQLPVLQINMQPGGNKNYINVKNKNRKFSYLTQPISMSKNEVFLHNDPDMRQSYVQQAEQFQARGQKQQGQPNIQKKGKGQKVHKHSEAITESNIKKRRFLQNPISFSQMIANINIHQNVEDSNFSGHSMKNTNKRVPRLELSSNTIDYSKNNIMCYNQPDGWVRKQVIYYFGDQQKPQRFIIDRTLVKKQQQFLKPNNIMEKPDNLRIQNNPNDLKKQVEVKSNRQKRGTDYQDHLQEQKSKQMMQTQKKSLENMQSIRINRNNASYSSHEGKKYINQMLNNTNNLRSTIQTSKSANTLPYSTNIESKQANAFNLSNKSQSNVEKNILNKQANSSLSSIQVCQSPKKNVQINYQPSPIRIYPQPHQTLNSINVVSPNLKKPNKIYQQYSPNQHKIYPNIQQLQMQKHQTNFYSINSPQSSSFQTQRHSNQNFVDNPYPKQSPNIYIPRSPLNNYPRQKACTFFYSPTHTATTIPSLTNISSQTNLDVNRKISKSPQHYRNNFFSKKEPQRKCLNKDPTKPCCTSNENVKYEQRNILSPPKVVLPNGFISPHRKKIEFDRYKPISSVQNRNINYVYPYPIIQKRIGYQDRVQSLYIINDRPNLIVGRNY